MWRHTLTPLKIFCIITKLIEIKMFKIYTKIFILSTFFIKNVVKLIFFTIPLFWQLYCKGEDKINIYRRIYTIEISNAYSEKIENRVFGVPRTKKMPNYRLSLYFALRGQEDSALKYFYRGKNKDDVENILLSIYIPRHIKRFTFDEKLKFIREGRIKARKKGLYGLVVDSYLIEGFVWKEEKDSIVPILVDSALIYSKSLYDSVVIRNNMLEIVGVNYFPKYHELDRKLNKKLRKMKPACSF